MVSTGLVHQVALISPRVVQGEAAPPIYFIKEPPKWLSIYIKFNPMTLYLVFA